MDLSANVFFCEKQLERLINFERLANSIQLGLEELACMHVMNFSIPF